MDNSVDTNVLDGNTSACSSTQVMNLGASVPTDPTTVVNTLSDSTNTLKPVGAVTLTEGIFLLTSSNTSYNKPYYVPGLKFGYSYKDTNGIHTESIAYGTISISADATGGCLTCFSSIYGGNDSGSLTVWNYTDIYLCGWSNISIGYCEYECSRWNCAITCSSDLQYSNDVYINSYDIHIGVQPIAISDPSCISCITSFKGTGTIELCALRCISIGLNKVQTLDPDRTYPTYIDSGIFSNYEYCSDYSSPLHCNQYVNELNLYGKCTSIYASDKLTLCSGPSTISLDSDGFYSMTSTYRLLTYYCTSISSADAKGSAGITAQPGCINIHSSNQVLIGSDPNFKTTPAVAIIPCNLFIEPSAMNIATDSYGLGVYSNGYTTYMTTEVKQIDDGTQKPTMYINTSVFDDATKQGAYEVTKGISTMSNENGIPDLVNRIFTYTGSCTAFCARPLSAAVNSMKDNILYEYEVWHTIPSTTGVTYVPPTDVEWLYGDPAESGIELTDGITLYYTFRAFKSNGAVRVQGNLYASTTSQSITQ